MESRETFCTTETVIRATSLAETLEPWLIYVKPFTLCIRSHPTIMVRSLIGSHPEYIMNLEDFIDRILDEPGTICIFDPHNVLSLIFPRPEK